MLVIKPKTRGHQAGRETKGYEGGGGLGGWKEVEDGNGQSTVYKAGELPKFFLKGEAGKKKKGKFLLCAASL